MQLDILGCYSATPRTFNNPTAQVLTLNHRQFLIDCGEGTQVAIRKQKIKFNKIKQIFISHLHGDHFFGLIGLISTFSLLNRQTELHIYGPKGIKQIILLQLKLSKSYTSYPLYFHELESKEPELIFEDDKVSVQTIPLQHRVYANGFLFTEKPGDRKLLIEEVQKYDIDVAYYRSIKKGKDIRLDNGSIVKNELLTSAPPPVKSYAFCSDTVYKPEIANQIQNVTALYHEATFLEKHEDLAKSTKHSTTNQAALIAKKANAKNLIIGHYSTRYKSIEIFKEEASRYFNPVYLAQDGKVFEF
ncbi:ribonuclease Z [Haloflavibacter putidus]|uniref:Ribonuclease Z n=1 Tax=Haloflavibacter putidus TaxID=2576776 RepID=A0A507ZRQ3_9FLAO|nr:ribonuclease Z [Haloflavibacter putidus]TQD40059.1 ribonuclease Z [Haloflavibacter putidus]